MVRTGQWAPDAPPLAQLRRSRLKRRLLAWFLLFSLAPLLVTNAVGYGRTSVILRRFVERYVSTFAETQAQHVHDRVERTTLMLGAIVAGNEFLASGALRALGRPAGEMGTVSSPVAIERFLQHKLEEAAELDAIYLFTPDGRVVGAAGTADAVVTTPPAEAHIPSVSAMVHGSGTAAEPLFRFVVPVRGADETVLAFLGATLNVNGFHKLVEVPPVTEGPIATFIVDDLGRPLFVSRDLPDVDFTSSLATPLDTLPAGAVEQYANREGEDVIATVAAIPGLPWRFVAELPSAQAFGDLQNLRGLSLILELLLAVLLGVIAWLVARDIVEPVGRLVHATRRVALGDLSARVDIRQRDEMGELGHAFNQMTTALADTTSRVRQLHEHEIERASQLATVGELASGVAHEIKNPVVGVAHGLDLVRRHRGPDPELDPIMDEMSRQLTRVQQTLQELLTFARPAVPTLAPVSANDIVARAIRLLQPTADRAGVRIEVWVDPSLPRFDADAEMLYQALVNVFLNALQATPCGGRINVMTRATANRVEMTIADTGRGIPPETLGSVFKPFFTTRHTGTGLGLFITREIAQRHGGGVTLVSTVGVGTTVTLHVPLHRARRPVAREAGAVPVA